MLLQGAWFSSRLGRVFHALRDEEGCGFLHENDHELCYLLMSYVTLYEVWLCLAARYLIRAFFKS